MCDDFQDKVHLPFVCVLRLSVGTVVMWLEKIAKPELNVALRPDSLTYLFTCGIVIFGCAHINFYDRN